MARSRSVRSASAGSREGPTSCTPSSRCRTTSRSDRARKRGSPDASWRGRTTPWPACSSPCAVCRASSSPRPRAACATSSSAGWGPSTPTTPALSCTGSRPRIATRSRPPASTSVAPGSSYPNHCALRRSGFGPHCGRQRTIVSRCPRRRPEPCRWRSTRTSFPSTRTSAISSAHAGPFASISSNASTRPCASSRGRGSRSRCLRISPHSWAAAAKASRRSCARWGFSRADDDRWRVARRRRRR